MGISIDENAARDTLVRVGVRMHFDRACPLLLSAACPLPADSLAHWTQYQRITHRNTTPQQIEIKARCENQDEHRLLQDWCEWIEDEVANASLVMMHARRHSNWVAPKATMHGDSRTIDIQPASSATYIPSAWRIELDSPQIIDRLIHDAYHEPLSFLRELIQNAADATRCRIYEELSSTGNELPAWPVDIDAGLRNNYPIVISIEERTSINSLSGEPQTRQVIVVEDGGVGMNDDIIRRYLLQIGRSYYKSPEFRRQFRFDPTSRFGIGFLSVFAVSDDIVVETFKPGQGSIPIRLSLRGPRSYLITERGSRVKCGTRVEVAMRDIVPIQKIKEHVEHWCRRLEFPIHLRDHVSTQVITAETRAQFLDSKPNVVDSSETFQVNGFPIVTQNCRGEIYVFTSVTDRGERWDRSRYVKYWYSDTHPMANAASVPESLICDHGIAVSPVAKWRDSTWSARVDVRFPEGATVLSRGRLKRTPSAVVDREIEDELSKLVARHLENSAFKYHVNEWQYKQALIREFDLPQFWRSVPETVRSFHRGGERLESIEEFVQASMFVTVQRVDTGHSRDHPSETQLVEMRRAIQATDQAGLTEAEVEILSDFARSSIFANYVPTRAVFDAAQTVMIFWTKVDHSPQAFYPTTGRSDKATFMVPFEGNEMVGLNAHKTTDGVYGQILLNSNHIFARWLQAAKRSSASPDSRITPAQFETVMKLLQEPVRYYGNGAKALNQYLSVWRASEALPPELNPPVLLSSCWLDALVELDE